MITARCENITDAIETGILLNHSRDKLSRRILTELDNLCKGTLLLNGLRYYSSVSLRTAWELALLDMKTKFLSTFLQGLRYIGLRVPEEGQYERLMLKYYGFLWRIRKYLKEVHALPVLDNLEKFPRRSNDEDEEYNRLTVYSKVEVSSNYSVQVGCVEADILLWENPSKIKVLTDWRVSIEPAALNKLAKVLKFTTKLTSKYNEYSALMSFLTETGINLLDLIDLRDERFQQQIVQIYQKLGTSYFRDVLMALHVRFHERSTTFGKNTIRYALIKLREELLEDILPEKDSDALVSEWVYLSKGCYAFERNPILYNLPKSKTNGNTISRDVLRAIGSKNTTKYLPYIRIKHLIHATGELYYTKEEVEYRDANQTISVYNACLSEWDKNHGRELKEENGYVYLDEYVSNTAVILQNLLYFSSSGNDGQQQLNHRA